MSVSRPFLKRGPRGAAAWHRVPMFFGVILLAVGLFFASPAGASTDPQPQMIPATFADVAAKASPAVVNISTVKVVKGGGAPFRFHGPSDPNDPFNQFFERFFGDQFAPRDRTEKSLGSGFIIDPDGLIITNNHVVEDADEVVVRMSDEKELDAKVLGRDAKTDLALIKINANVQLPYLELGNSADVRIGDWVVAIGNPFGLDHTVTAGILSARGRVIGAGPYDDFLQTDASINPGNSGGPLLNLKGEVIGINTAIVAQGQGIGFAIPANMAAGIVRQLKEKGRVIRGWLGVMIQKVTPELAASFKLEGEGGALVADVTSGGPAASAGIRRGDVIVSFDGKIIKEWSELPVIVAATDVGAKVDVVVIRDGEKQTLSVEIAELDEERITLAEPEKMGDLGVSVQDLTPELADRLGTPETAGVVVTGVADGSPADEAGMRPGDVILEINRGAIKDVDDYRKAVSGIAKGETVLLLVRRGENTLFFALKIR